MSKTSRHQTRFALIQIIYQNFITETEINLEEYKDLNNIDKVDITFLNEIYTGLLQNIDNVTEKLNKTIRKRNLNKLDLTVKCILFLATYELLYHDTPRAVVVNEYVSLCKRFYSDSEYKFVHGVIDSIEK